MTRTPQTLREQAAALMAMDRSAMDQLSRHSDPNIRALGSALGSIFRDVSKTYLDFAEYMETTPKEPA